MTFRSNFIFANLFDSDQNNNRAIFKTLYNSVENTGTHIRMVINRLNKLGGDITTPRNNIYKLIEKSSNSNFFHNTVLLSINNNKDIDDLVSKNNIYYLALCGEPQQEINTGVYASITANITAKELLNQIDMYTQAHKNDISMGLEEVLKYTTGNFALILYEAPTNSVYLFSSNKTVYVHQDDDSVYVYTDKPVTTDLEVVSSSNIDNRTIYSFNSTGKYFFKQNYVDDPRIKSTKYDLVMNYNNSIESFILPYIVDSMFNPNKITINADLVLTDDQYIRLKDSFNRFDLEDMPLSKGQLLFNWAANRPINYIDFTNNLIEIEKAEKVISIQTGSRYIPVFKNLQDHEILQLGIYLKVPFSKFESNCNHPTRDKHGCYILCGECDSCKELYKRFAQLGYTLDNMPIRFKNILELDKIKLTSPIIKDTLTESEYLALRNKIVEVFPYDLH